MLRLGESLQFDPFCTLGLLASQTHVFCDSVGELHNYDPFYWGNQYFIMIR